MDERALDCGQVKRAVTPIGKLSRFTSEPTREDARQDAFVWRYSKTCTSQGEPYCRKHLATGPMSEGLKFS